MSEDAPTYPTNAVDTSLVPLGRLPLGGAAGSSRDVSFDPRPTSEGGCSAGRLEGCSIFNIKVRCPMILDVRAEREFFLI